MSDVEMYTIITFESESDNSSDDSSDTPIRWDELKVQPDHLYVVIYGVRYESPIAFRCGPKITIKYLNSVLGFGGARGFYKIFRQTGHLLRLDEDDVRMRNNSQLEPGVYRILDYDPSANSYWRFIF